MGVPFKAKNGLDANSNKIVNVANPTTAQDAATKLYVDNAVGTGLPSQTGNNGKFLTTNGTTASWSLVPVGGISATGTPSSTTYLRGDGTWATVTSGSGDVVGPASATDNAVVRFDGTTGKLIQNSTVTLSDTGVLTVPELSTASITSTGNNPIVIAPDGTGDVHLNADSVRIGDNNTDATLTTHGTGDLILTTHEGSATQGIIRLYDGANGNITITPNGTGGVGIGKTPSYKLDVNGTINGTTFYSNGYTLAQQSSSYIQLYRQDGGIGIFLGGADPANYYDNLAHIFRDRSGGEWARINSTGLGIANASPQSLLHIGGNGNATITTSYDLQFNHYYSTWGANATRPYLRKAWNATVNDYLYLGATGNGPNTAMGAILLSNAVPFSCGYGSNTADGLSNEFLRVTNTGNVGIGISSPAHKLDVSGKTRLGNGATQGAPSTSNIGTNAELLIGGTGGNYLAIGQYDSSSSYAHWIQSAYEVPSTAIYNMVLQPLGGNVGISNTAPSQKLDINGNIRLFGSSNNVYLLLRNNHQSIWGARVLCWDYGDGQGINFETSDNTDAWGTRMVVRHNGNVGISTTAPAYKLDINGTARTTGRFYSNEWIQFDNFSALYSPHNGAHFLPNASSYGSWKILGQRNGWCGLEFETTSNGNVSLMIRPDAIETGFHNNSNGWQLRWNGGTLYCHKGTYGGGTVATVLDSSNYSSYAIPNSGSWLGDLGSYGFTRYAGMSMSGGAEVVFLYKGGQGYTLVDGNYMAFEGGGFYSSSNSSGGTLIGMKAIATNTLELNARTSIRRSAYSVGANDFFMELTAPDDGSGSGEIGLRFHLENRYWRQIRANSGGFKFTQGGNNDTVPITAYNVIAENDIGAARYINAGYFNQSSPNNENAGVGQIIATANDNYLRKVSPSFFKTALGLYSGPAGSGTITISTSAPSGGATNDIWLQW